MNDYHQEARSFQIAVEEEAARLVREGIAAPWDAVVIARDNVQRRRQKRTADRMYAHVGTVTIRERE